MLPMPVLMHRMPILVSLMPIPLILMPILLLLVPIVLLIVSMFPHGGWPGTALRAQYALVGHGTCILSYGWVAVEGVWSLLEHLMVGQVGCVVSYGWVAAADGSCWNGHCWVTAIVCPILRLGYRGG